MPRNGLGMPIVSGASNAPVTVIDDVLWEDFGGSGGEIAVNYQETRTNSVLYSQDTTQAEQWTKQNSAIDSALYEAPDNSTTANAIKSSGTGEQLYTLAQTISVTAGKTYTASAHIKKGNLTFAQLRFADGDGLPRAHFNLTTGATTHATNTIRTQIDAMDDDWYRCSITFVATTSSGSIKVFAQSVANDGTPNVAVSGVILLYVWGFQLEESIEATAYIVTTTGARTATTTLNDTSDVWDFDGADLMPEADPDSEGVWEETGNIVLNGDYEELGSEQVTNGDFSTDSDWTKGIGWTISGGTANGTPASNTHISQGPNNWATTGKIYKTVYTVSNYQQGICKIQFSGGGTVSGTNRTANGTYTEYITATADHTTIRLKGLSNHDGFIGSIDNLSVKQVDPNDRWTLGTGWSIEDGKLKATSTDAEATQASIITPGNSYEITFTIDSIASGSVRVKAGTTAGSTRTSAGTYTQVLDVLYGADLVFDMVSSGTCVIDNVTVKEYAIQPQDV